MAAQLGERSKREEEKNMEWGKMAEVEVNRITQQKQRRKGRKRDKRERAAECQQSVLRDRERKKDSLTL